MHISNFQPVKRVNDCIRAFALVRREMEAELVMAGDGPDRGPAEGLARGRGVEDAVIFLGKQDHIERLIPRMHSLHLPSELESFGLAALEAMAGEVVPSIYFSGQRRPARGELTSSVSCILFWLASADGCPSRHLSRALGNPDKQLLP